MNNPLDRGLNVAILHIASRLFPTGFDVGANAPETFEAINEHIARTGRMLVWNGASENTIYDDAEVNYAFRAWHDWCHWFGHFDFSLGGERLAAEMQKAHLRSLYVGCKELTRWEAIIDAEVNGQAAYAEYWGIFPNHQRAFVEAYLSGGIEAGLRYGFAHLIPRAAA